MPLLFLAGLLLSVHSSTRGFFSCVAAFGSYCGVKYCINNYPKPIVALGSLIFARECWKKKDQLSKKNVSKKHALGVVSNVVTISYLVHMFVKHWPKDAHGEAIPWRNIAEEKYQPIINTILGNTCEEQFSSLTGAIFAVELQALLNAYLCYDAMIPKKKTDKEPEKAQPVTA